LGALVDSGTIRAASAGIEVNSAAVIVGGIQVSSKGKIIALPLTSSGTGVTGIAVQNTTSFGGGITNSGTISAQAAAILAFNVSTFAGGITNSGTLGESVVLVQLSSFTGGIGNSGKINSPFAGIRLNSVGTFAGGIGNSKVGTIIAKSGDGIVVGTTSGTPATVSSFSGGITNSGTISGGHSNAGVFVDNASLFAGGIVNNSGGRIAAGSNGIQIKLVTTFTGGISNSGTITAKSHGIVVSSVAMFGSGGPGGRHY
jgi:hypothetical protein